MNHIRNGVQAFVCLREWKTGLGLTRLSSAVAVYAEGAE